MTDASIDNLVVGLPGLRFADSEVLEHAQRALMLLSQLEMKRTKANEKASSRPASENLGPDRPVRDSPAANERSSPASKPPLVPRSPPGTASPQKHTPPPMGIRPQSELPRWNPNQGTEGRSIELRLQSHRTLISCVDDLMKEEEPQKEWTHDQLAQSRELAAWQEVASQATSRNHSLRGFLRERDRLLLPAPAPKMGKDWRVASQRRENEPEVISLRNQLVAQPNLIVNPHAPPPLDDDWVVRRTSRGDFVVMQSPRDHVSAQGFARAGQPASTSPLESAEDRVRRREAERIFKDSILRNSGANLADEVAGGRAIDC